MQLEPWQIPVLAMAAVVLPPSVMGFVGYLRSRSARPGADARGGVPEKTPAEDSLKLQRTRRNTFAVLTVALLGIAVLAIGPERASLLATAASVVSAAVSATLAVQSFLAIQEIRNKSADQ